MTKRNVKTFLGKYKWWIAGFVFLYPFYCPLINKIAGLNLGELYTFNLPQTEFMTVWFALGGIFGVVYNIILTQKRITIQENQQYEQKLQFTKQIEKQDNQIEIQQKNFDAQIKKQDDQIQIQQKQLRDTRFSSGVELLGNQHESARIGGAYNLYFLANEHRDEYLEPVCEILCAHIRSITSDKEYQKKYQEKTSNEIQTILHLLFKKDKFDYLLFNDCPKNLSGTFLCKTDFTSAQLSNVDFCYAKLSNVEFYNANLSNVDFMYAELNSVEFRNAKLNKVEFHKAKLNGVGFSFPEIGMGRNRYYSATLNDVDFSGAELDKVKFHDAKLNKVEFHSAKLNEVEFSLFELGGKRYLSAKLSDVKFFHAELNKVKFGKTELSDIDFWGAKLNEVDFQGTILENCSYEEITDYGRSRKLTKSKDERKS